MKKLTLAEIQLRLDTIATCGGNLTEAARRLGLARSSLQHTTGVTAINTGMKVSANAENPNDIKHMQAKIKRLEKELKDREAKDLTNDAISKHIFKLRDGAENTVPPKWMLEPKSNTKSPGVPTLFLSDLHWGEVVHSSQINGVNKYNLKIAHERLKTVAESAINLLKILSPSMDYPGIVIPLGGDMISGNIHDELIATNEANSIEAVLDLFSHLASLISGMADQFGSVQLPCVSGNHGRDTHKIWAKNRNVTSFDWMLYKILQRHFENDKRISFQIPDGPDAYFKIFNHRYLLTHGDQFRGGDGMIGALGPIIRGDHKKRSRNSQIGMEYETMLMGHWHQYIHLWRLVVNGSLKGLDEYAYSNNFPFEPPVQSLWVTHPERGITFRMPVYADTGKMHTKTLWHSVPV